MEVKTFRAKSMQEALQRVRRELGDDAAVLRTREVRVGWWQWLTGDRDIEVTAATEIHVPSRLPRAALSAAASGAIASSTNSAGVSSRSWGARLRADARVPAGGRSLVEDLCQASKSRGDDQPPTALFDLFTTLIEAEVGEEVARDLVERARIGLADEDLNDVVLLKSRVLRMLENELSVSGPIRVTPGQRRIAALVGPTGVGKTTTIAKLAANFRLREKQRVGLITVDTYRIAAVEQLRTYADIMDLPMEIVATPREMHLALQRLRDLDLLLLDTAGRSPRDEVRIQELKSILGEAQADEVHLVLSCTASLPQLKKAVDQFSRVGVTSLLLTKLDEATGLGNLLPVLRDGRLPLSYLTNGQNVPDDIEPADRRALARRLLTGPEGGW